MAGAGVEGTAGGTMVRLTAQDGFCLDAYEMRAAGHSVGGLVILQEIFGLTDQLKSVARYFAARGFDTVVPSLIDRSAPKTVVPFDQPDRGRELMGAIPFEATQLDTLAAMREVDRGNGVSLLGFCLGGGLALRLAGEVSVVSAVSYYGTKLANCLNRVPGCPLLFHFGASDPNSPPELIATLRAALPAAETHVYEAGHAFANDARAAYVREAAELAHARTVDFLRRAHAAGGL